MDLPPPVPAAAPATTGWRDWLRRSENALVVAALAVMVILPCLEIVLRKFFHTGLTSSVPVVQHLVLAVGTLGAALAARENRLLSLSTLSHYLKGRYQSAALAFSSGFAAAVSALLCAASVQFVLDTRVRGKELAYGVPVWVVQGLLVVGFALIALRLVWHGGRTWRGRLVTLAVAGVLGAIGLWTPLPAAQLRWPGLIALAMATAMGAPVFTALGGAALILVWSGGDTVASIPLNHYRLSVNPTLPTIPLFTLAGYFLAEGGAARRLLALFNAWFGQLRGGPAIVTVFLCAFFTSFTGASGVTIIALGGLLMPILLASGYRERNALGLLSGAGSLGLLFPPCLPPILYSIVASSGGATSVTIEQMFQGGLLPGLVMMAMAAAWGVVSGPKQVQRATRFDARTAWAAVWEAKWELLIPVVALVSLFSGWATPVEAAAVTAAYAFVVEVFLYRDLKLVKDVPRVMTECGLLVGGVLLIVGIALGFTHFLIDAQLPDQCIAWVTGAVKSKWVFLLLLNLFLLVVGALMEIYAAIVVVVPLLVPIGNAFGIDPIHLGIIFLANLELGFLMPPVGMNLLLASYRFNKPMAEVTRASFPMLLVLLVGVFLITYVPPLTTFFPGLFKPKPEVPQATASAPPAVSVFRFE
jgi:C4-dicarboxylate transporter, DctM subunit